MQNNGRLVLRVLDAGGFCCRVALQLLESVTVSCARCCNRVSVAGCCKVVGQVCVAQAALAGRCAVPRCCSKVWLCRAADPESSLCASDAVAKGAGGG